MAFTKLTLTVDGAVAHIGLDQPDTRNAFDDVVIADLTQAFTEAGALPQVRAIVLGASGPAFCAGANLHWMRRMADYTRDENLADAGKLATMLRTIPSVSAIAPVGRLAPAASKSCPRCQRRPQSAGVVTHGRRTSSANVPGTRSFA